MPAPKRAERQFWRTVRQSLETKFALGRLRDEVQHNVGVDQVAVLLLDGLADQIEAVKTDPAALQRLVTALRRGRQRLARRVGGLL